MAKIIMVHEVNTLFVSLKSPHLQFTFNFAAAAEECHLWPVVRW